MDYLSYLRTSLSAATNDAQTRWNAAKPAILGGTYTADQWFKDSLHVWLLTMHPLWNVWAVSLDVQVPIVAFDMRMAGTNPQPVTVYILPPAGTPPAVHVTDLQRLGGTQIVQGDVDVTAVLSDSALTVTIKNLGSLPRGNYQGAVYFGAPVDRMIALVNLTID